MRYLMIVQYNGRGYCGFEKQNNSKTIQGELNKALLTILKQEISTTASGRTDSKVSAYCQPVHFDVDEVLDEAKLLRSLNGLLPTDIKVLSIAPTTIHACTSAKKKTYVYKMYLSNLELPLYGDALRISPNLNFKAMKKFARMLVGTHDFAGFQSSGSPTKTTVRTIYNANLKRYGLYLYFSITGNGFLYKMVRNIVGTILCIGGGKLNLSDVKQNLFKGFKSIHTAKPEYLYLAHVKY